MNSQQIKVESVSCEDKIESQRGEAKGERKSETGVVKVKCGIGEVEAESEVPVLNMYHLDFTLRINVAC